MEILKGRSMDRQQEIEEFKRNINLALYAEDFGYSLDKNKSSTNTFILKSAEDALVVSINRNSHWQYFNSNNDAKDQGTIIDFLQNRTALNFGQIRKKLREFSGYREGFQTPIPIVDKTDINRVKNFIKHCKPVVENEYLYSRDISFETLNAPLFKNRILEGYKGAAIFPHYGHDGITSYEVTNKDFKHFPDFGKRGLWLSRAPTQVDRVVFLESPVEALSYYQYHKEPVNTLLVSGSGNWSKSADALILVLAEKYRSAVLVAGFNNDKGGYLQTERLEKILSSEFKLTKEYPIGDGADWNKLLNIEEN